MSARKSVCVLAGVLRVAWLFAAGARADDLPALPPPLQVTVVNAMPRGEPVFRACVTAGTNKFAFLVPGGFRLDANHSTPEVISLVSKNYNGWLTLRIAGPMPEGGKELESGPCRELLLSRHPGAKILNEFSLTAAGRSGLAFDLQWEMTGGMMQSMRVAFIPSEVGVLEFSLAASQRAFSKYQGSFNTMLISFRASVNGKLEAPPLSDKS
jgi:hypothetical protein